MSWLAERVEARVRWLAGLAYDRIMDAAPPEWAARFELWRPPRRDPLGPFNGQVARQAMLRELCGAVAFSAIVETGTYHGLTTEYLHSETGLPVYTVEANPRHHHYSRLRIGANPNVHLFCDDSRRFLRGLSQTEGFPRERVLFYLDAHWKADLPLGEECEIIAEKWSDSVVVIDDFEVPDDAGYGYDDYGPGKRLCIDLLSARARERFAVFWPKARASEETGARRGYVLLANARLAETVSSMKTLRPGEMPARRTAT